MMKLILCDNQGLGFRSAMDNAVTYYTDSLQVQYRFLSFPAMAAGEEVGEIFECFRVVGDFYFTRFGTLGFFGR
jgi:hypothetical protein